MNRITKAFIAAVTLFSIFIAVSYVNATNVDSKFKLLEKKVQNTFQEGDIIFQTSDSKQCEAIQIATESKYSHCGIIFIENGKTMVYEAVQPVKKTPLKQWIAQGKESKYVVKRLKNTILSPTVSKKMKRYGMTFNNKDYDLYFEWSDDKIYCSELVWKIYKNSGIELCPLKKLKDFNLKHPSVQKIMKERYGHNIPYNENVVAPSQLFESGLLETVFDNY